MTGPEIAHCPFCEGSGTSEKRAPVQGFQPGIPWSMHLRAYDAYRKRHGEQKSLIEGWCRGGFGVGELDMFIPGWRKELSELELLRAEVARLRAPASLSDEQVEAVADAIDAARYRHPEHPRDRPHPFCDANKGDREYAFRLARAALTEHPARGAL